MSVVIPPGVTSGVYEFDQVDDDSIGQLYEGKLILDSTFGKAAYGCANCCGYSALGLAPDPNGVAVGLLSQDRVYAENACTGNIIEKTGTAFGWGIGNWGIAGIDSSGLVSGFLPGSTTSGASVTLRTPDVWNCPQATQSVANAVNVNPTVSLLGSNDYAYVGTADPAVAQKNTFFASGSPAGGSYAWSSSDTRITFDGTSSSVHATVPFPSTSLHDKTISVTYSVNGRTSQPAQRAITARIFKYLGNDTLTANAIYSGPSQYGYDYTATYNVYTNPSGQLASDISDISTYENVAFQSGDPSITPTTSSGNTDVNSRVIDGLRLVNSTPLPSGLSNSFSQDLGVGGFFVRNNTLVFTASGVTVTSHGPFN